MTRRSGGLHEGGMGPGKKIAIGLLLIGCGVYLAWIVVQASVVAAFASKQPLLAEKLASDDPRVVFSLAKFDFAKRRGTISDPMLARVSQVYQTTPLPEEPLLYHGVRAALDGDRARASRFYEEAARRAPRSRLARLFMLDQHLRTGRIQEATAEIGVLVRLVPQAHQLLVPELAKYARDPATVNSLQKALVNDPDLAEALLSHLASAGDDADLVLKLAGSQPRGTGGAWQGKLIDSLVAKGDVARARTLWQRTASPEVSKTLIYDPTFRGLSGLPPFNWALTSGKSGVAEPRSKGGLEVQYYGRDDVKLAQQLIILPPATYRLTMRVEGKVSEGNDGGLSWVVTCQNNKREIAKLPFRNITYVAKSLSMSFEIPNGCSAQWLTLEGTAREYPVSEAVTITELALSRGTRS